ncbi:Pfs domain-containing protein [Pochonia chlamydosporia 170]|uniref:Pfs domain-containing protein n=1 Tax=Pochonia chlamydosporia 170 TaxID=1380566 RepID=A0A179EZF4_METCM|nr:Pfs domain-containing protein [Pochonia chlamydosporia 170]OAQ58223.1 Pfs domain-containing protein [Pochonia chlamydosporia 170]
MDRRTETKRTRGQRDFERTCSDNDAPCPKTNGHKRQKRDKDGRKHGQDEQHHDTTFIPHDKYHIGWICALPDELAAAEGMLDDIHERCYQPRSDTNTYTLGTIVEHHVVLACLPAQSYGTNNAAVVATNMRRTFASIHFWLLVGTGGGAPGKVDIRLGDVVVSTKVLQIDLGKIVRNGQLHRIGLPRTPSQGLMTAVTALQAKHKISPSQISKYVDQLMDPNPRRARFADPGADLDLLFDSSHEHIPNMTENCSLCNKSRLLRREARSNRDPIVHYGTIASANQVMRDAKTRDLLTKELGVICFEMEAAGLMESCSSIVIRGISDYADSHKNDQWQSYAAAAAAAYAKEFLSIIPLTEESEAKAEGVMQKTQHTTARRSRNNSSGGRTAQPASQKVHRIRGVKAGDDANQMILSNGTPLRVEKATVRNRGLQLFGDVSLQDALKFLDRRNVAASEEAAEETITSSAGGSATI